MKNNKDKSPVDESVLEETPPDINEPQTTEDTPPADETPAPDSKDEVTPTPDFTPEPITPEPKKEDKPVETQEEKDRRYKSQQTEAQIQRAKAEALKNKVKEAAKVGEPTEDEMRAFVNAKGASWDDLTPFEQATQKELYVAKKQFSLVQEGVEADDKIQVWADKVDTFIDST